MICESKKENEKKSTPCPTGYMEWKDLEQIFRSGMNKITVLFVLICKDVFILSKNADLWREGEVKKNLPSIG